jgi:hypothetical protein
MTLNAVFRWKHPDSTLDMNRRLQTLVPRAIFDGGNVTPGAGLTVNVSPFKGISYDGMLVYDDATQNLGVVAGQVNYILVHAQYVTGSTPTVQWLVKDSVTYAADPLKDYYIVFATVDLAPAAVSVTNTDISFIPRDAVDPMQRNPYRGTTTSYATLPAEPPERNHDGDLYFALNSSGANPGQTFYFWEDATSSWQLFNSGSYNVETSNMVDSVIRGERNRIEQGSGVLAGKRPAVGFASETEIDVIETPSVANQVGFDTFSALVNGHYVQAYARNVTMPAKPAGTRYDLVFLEVWRENIAVPENHDFERNPDGTLTYTITQVSDKVESIAWQAGSGGDNFNLNEILADDHQWAVTKYRLATIQGVTSQSLYDNEVAAASGLNVDGNAFAAVPGTGIDERVWRATSATGIDGYSWAIPLFVVKRTSAEDHTIGNAIKEFRSDVRYIFPVYAVTDQSQAARLNLDLTQRIQTASLDQVNPVSAEPSGFVTGMDYQLAGGAAPNTLRLKEFGLEGLKIQMRGMEDYIGQTTTGDLSIELDSPPATGYERSLVYLKMSQTLYADSDAKDNTYISDRHRPWFPSEATGGTLLGMGWKRGYVTYEFVHLNLGAAATELDEHDAMTTAGWSKGDQSQTGALRYADGGIWSKAVAIDADDRIHPYLYEWAIPIALVHRRNSGAWNYATNPNGSGASRPDSRTVATVIYADDLVDLRRLVGVDEGRLKEMIEADIDKLMRGQLRTRMAEKWAGSAGAGGAVAGSRILQSDIAEVSGAGDAFPMPAANETRKIWSDAREFVPVATSFDLSGNHNDDYVTWTNASGTLVIKAPSGTHLVRNLPSSFYADANSSNATYLDFLGQPCWTTQEDHATAYPTPCALKLITAAGPVEQDFFSLSTCTDDPAFTVTASDNYGRATQMTLVCSSLAGHAVADIATVSFWVHRDRAPAGNYANNYGLAEIPDEVHSATLGPLGASPEELNIGTLYTVVRKTAGAATVTISSADVLAASGTTGTAAVIVGIGDITYGASLGGTTLSSTVLSTSVTTQDTVVLTYSAPIAMDIDVVVYYTTDSVDKWIEVGKGGKSLRAYYTWHEEDIDFGGAAPADYAFDLGTAVWSYAEVGGELAFTPQVWTSVTGTSGPWTQIPLNAVTANIIGHRHSNLVSFPASSLPGMGRYCKIVVPKWVAPAGTLSNEVLVHYTYTPYQGLSGSGAVATAGIGCARAQKHAARHDHREHGSLRHPVRRVQYLRRC